MSPDAPAAGAPIPAAARGEPLASDAQAVKTRIWRQGVLLFLATVLNSGQGVVFWAIASRLVSASSIGFAASLLSLAALASSAALFGLDQSLIRFLAEVRRPRRLFASSLLLTGAVGAALGGLAVLVVYAQVHSAPEELVEILPAAGAGLALLAVGFRLTNVLFLTAGHSGWVLIQSTILGVGKILLLVLLVVTVSVGAGAILLAFGGSYVLAVAVGLLAGLAMWPAVQPGRTAPTTGDIGRFSLGNYVSSNVWTVPDRIAPSLVLIFFSAAATSYFYYGQLVALTLFYLPESICTSAFAHAAQRRESSAHRMQSLAPALAVLTIVLAAVTVVLAPWILWILGGPSYAAHATLLRIYAVSTIPQAGVFYLQSVYNVERRMRELVWIGVISGAATLVSLGALLELRVPFDDIPAAWIVGSSVGLLVGVSWERPAERPSPRPRPTFASIYAEVLRPAVLDAYLLVVGLFRPTRSPAAAAASEAHDTLSGVAEASADADGGRGEAP
jgi:O-antigen/teichoic acid export membrane protein